MQSRINNFWRWMGLQNPQGPVATGLHNRRDSPGGSMRRGQRAFRPDNKEDRHTG